MNTCKKRTFRSGVACLALMAGLAAAPAAKAQFQQELDFQIHLGNAVAGLGNLTLLDVLNFTGGFQTAPTSGTGLGVGDTSRVDLVGNITACNGLACVTSTGAVLGLNYELTFFSRLRNVVVNVAPPNVNANNTPVLGDTVLELYVDTTLDAVPTPDPQAGAGGGMAGPVRDPAGDPTALLIATFELVQPGGAICNVAPAPNCDGTVFNTTNLDGSVDSTYQLVADPFGIFFKSDGVTPLPLLLTFAATDTNSDIDPDNNGAIDTTFAAGPFGGQCNTILGDSCGTVDGSVIVATQVPEPAALGLLGVGLAMFAFGLSRRRRQERVA